MKLVSMAEHEQLRGLWPQSYEFFFKYSLFSPLKMQKADILNLFCSKAVTLARQLMINYMVNYMVINVNYYFRPKKLSI
jgi:hypothetical protein